MAPARTRCPGCTDLFTTAGVERHQRHTAKPECAAIYTQRLHAEIERTAEQNQSEKASSEGEDAEDADELPEPFGGDLFGAAEDYGPEDFPLPPESEDEDERDDAGDDVELEGGWEPDVDMDIGGGDAAMDIEIDERDSGPHPPPAAEVRQQAEGRFVRKPIIATFNNTEGCNAGAPVCTTNTEHEAYQNAMPEGTSSNIFAPFSSEMEWMIADWAKTRGPSATAFTELLGIEGVCAHPVSKL